VLIYHLSSLTQAEVRESLPLHNETSFWIGELRSIAEHLTLYFVLALLLQACMAAWGLPVFSDFRWALGILAIAASYGVLLEFLQDSTPGRTTSINDMLTNSAGALAASIIGPYIVDTFRPRPEPSAVAHHA
jgi:VanZ family protein